jgi:hypothetical protein
MGIAIDKIRRQFMNDVYQIENLTEAETVKFIYNKKNVKFGIGDYTKFNNPKEIEEKIRLLKIINTKNSNKLTAVLEIAKVGGWQSVFQNDVSTLTKLKDKLKLYYNADKRDFFICLNEVNIYRPYMETNINTLSNINIKGKYKIPYGQLRTKIIDDLKKRLKENDKYKPNNIPVSSILSNLYRPFEKYVGINLEKLYKILNYEDYIINDENDKGIPNREIIPLNIENFIKTLNKITENSNIIIKAEYWTENIIKTIAQHYEKFNNMALQFFFKNMIDKTLGEAMILTYVNFKNIGFVSGFYGFHGKYPKKYEIKVKNAYKIYRKYAIEVLLNNFKNNKFEDVEVDDKGNVINIFPNTKRFLLKDIIQEFGKSISIK